MKMRRSTRKIVPTWNDDSAPINGILRDEITNPLESSFRYNERIKRKNRLTKFFLFIVACGCIFGISIA